MRKSRFSESQIVAILNEHDAGVPTAELARKHGIHANTLRLWKAKYGGMDASSVTSPSCSASAVRSKPRTARILRSSSE